MRDLEDIEIGGGEVAVVMHRPRNSDANVKGVAENKDALRELVDERLSRLERPHAFVRISSLRE